jgi:hypothetical protein
MGDRMQLQIVLLGRQVVEQHNRGLATRKEMFQHEDLAAVSKRTLCQQPKLRQAVQDNARGIGRLNPIEDQLCGLPPRTPSSVMSFRRFMCPPGAQFCSSLALCRPPASEKWHARGING